MITYNERILRRTISYPAQSVLIEILEKLLLFYGGKVVVASPSFK